MHEHIRNLQSLGERNTFEYHGMVERAGKAFPTARTAFAVWQHMDRRRVCRQHSGESGDKAERIGKWTYYQRNEETIREFGEYVKSNL